MKAIPDVIISSDSNAERRVFDIVKQIDLGPDWCAYHSLNCSEHEYKRWAEIDFLILGPEGAIVLEIKGGRVSCKDGVWTFTDRYERSRRSSEGPFNQARTAMHALEKLLDERYGIESVTRGRLIFGFGVVFPDIDWDIDSPEMPAEIVADRFTLATAKGFKKYLKGLIGYWRDKKKQAGTVDAAELRTLRQKLRPDVDVYPPMSVRLGAALDQMQSLTTEQYERLEIIDQNDRVVITGGAGTGKTFLLMQCARREAASGRNVLVLVKSAILAAYLRSIEISSGIQISAFDIIDDGNSPVDVLLVDEGQDLLNLDCLSSINELVAGGFDEGRWRWFMDDNNQSGVAGQQTKEGREHLFTGGAAPTIVPLRFNVRNTKEIANKVQLWTGADIGESQVAGYGSDPNLVEYEDLEELAVCVEKTANDLQHDDIGLEEIGVILPNDTETDILSLLPKRLRKKIVPLDVNTVRLNLQNRLVWGTAEQFKGLERPVMLAIGFDQSRFLEERLSEFYVAVTRGNYSLWLFVSRQFRERLRKTESTNRKFLSSAST